MSWVVVSMPRNKLIAFRPTNEEKAILREYMAGHGIKKENAAIRAMAFLKPKTVSSSMVDKPVETTTKTKEFRQDMLLLPSRSPELTREIKRFLRGQHSELVKTLLEITPDALNRAFTVATPKGILTLIPCMHGVNVNAHAQSIPSTTTHDSKGGLA